MDHPPVASYGWDPLSSLGVFAADVYVGLLLVLLVLYPVLVKVNGQSVRSFADADVTASDAAVLDEPAPAPHASTVGVREPVAAP